MRPNSSPVSVSWSKPGRLVAAALLTLAATMTAACGMDQQTLRPYTAAEGISIDVGGPRGVKVRNLMILSRTEGEGFLSGTLVATERNELTAVSGKAIKSDGSDGAPLTASIPSAITLEPGVLVVLTAGPAIAVQSPDLRAGLVAEVTLDFNPAGSATLQVPVVDANQPPYSTVTPVASPTPAS